LPSALGAALDGRIWAPGPLQSVVDAAWAGPAWVTVGVFGLFALMGGGLSEELGWRGYALSWIQTYYTTLTAGIVIALYWSVWHIAPPVWEILFTQGLGPFLASAGATVGQYVALSTPLSILFVWAVNRSGGSVLMAVFFHASWNTTALTLMELYPARYLLETSLLIWVLAIVVVAADRAHFFSRGAKGGPAGSEGSAISVLCRAPPRDSLLCFQNDLFSKRDLISLVSIQRDSVRRSLP